MYKHPKELWILSLTELCERFAFWGVTNLLVLYLIEYFQFSNDRATHIYGIFTGCAAFLPLVGGYLADRWNYQFPLFFGALLNAIGCFLIAIGTEGFLYLALAIIACGFGMFTPSVLTVLGYTYRHQPDLREAGFSIYYASINVGVFLALASLGMIVKLFNWHVAFIVAGIVQLIGLIPLTIYLVQYKKTYQGLQAVQKREGGKSHGKLSIAERKNIFIIIIFCIASIFFWTAYNQAFSSMAIFAHDFMNKEIGGVSLPAPVFLSSESFFLIILAPILAYLYAKLQKINRDPSPVTKTALSLLFISACFLVMMIGAFTIPDKAQTADVSSSYLIGAYFLMAIGEMLLAPIGLSIISRLAPQRYAALSIGIWYGCLAIAYYSGGVLAGFMDKVGGLFNFFAIFVVITFIPAIILFIFSKRIIKMQEA